jgi:hypothetical protein
LPAPPKALAGLPGEQIGPPNPDYMTAADFINIARFDPNADPAQVMQKAQEFEQKRIDVTTEGVYDRAANMFYRFPKGDVVEREIPGTGKTFRLTPQQAILHDIYLSNNDPRYWDLAKQIMEGPTRPGEPAGAPGAKPAGAGAPGAAPGAGRQGFRSKSEAEAEAAEAETIAKKRAETAVEKENELGKALATADTINFVTTQAREQIKAAGPALGVLAKPGIGSALGTLISEGLRVGQTSIGIPAIEEAIRKANPKITQEELNQVTSLAGNLAELELLYTQIFLSKQGQVTEGERAIVRRIPGTLSTDSKVLDEKMRLLQMRADYDRRRIEAFFEYMEREPRGNYVKFERSPDFKRIREEYNNDLYAAFNLKRPGSSSAPTAPTAPRAPAAPSAGSDFARQIKERANQLRKGEQ